MTKTTLPLFILLLLGILSCSTTKESSRVKVVKDSDASDKTVINYNRTISAGQATYIAQLMQEKLAGFPKDDLPIRFEDNTKNSTLRIHLKKNKVQLNYRSKLSLNKDNPEVRTIHQLKETIAAL